MTYSVIDQGVKENVTNDNVETIGMASFLAIINRRL